MKLAQQTFLITGASAGIGRALAVALAQQGAHVIAWGRNAERLQELTASHPNIQVQVVDLTQVAQLEQTVATLLSHMTIDCLINNAGIQHAKQLLDADYGLPDIMAEVSTNLLAPIELTRLLLPHLLTRPQARVLMMSSGLALMPKAESAVYCATKAAIHSLSEGLQLQLQASQVTVTECILPLVDTAMTAGRGRGKIMPAQAAGEIVLALQQPARPMLYVGKSRLLPFLLRFAPYILRRILQVPPESQRLPQHS
ncbi:SDR family NAD(P)-dependent oxidoreductase [Undibacterium sp. Di27W]|uniref:SDR family NAD(P)-dependent oxidoreductase n=1 Tax=Undibacterium sp. Di27W TaxID=3413036 RepID=UPI003BF45758